MSSVRDEQIEFGRRVSAEDNQRLNPGASPAWKKKPKAANKKLEGHEAFLKALETSGALIEIITIAGETLVGTVKHSDKFTISLKLDGSERTLVIFKHSIESFECLTPPVVKEVPAEVTN